MSYWFYGLLNRRRGYTLPRVRIPPSPPVIATKTDKKINSLVRFFMQLLKLAYGEFGITSSSM